MNRGSAPGALVGGEPRERDDPAQRAGRRRSACNSERVVLLGVLAGARAGEAGVGEILHVGLPAQPGGSSWSTMLLAATRQPVQSLSIPNVEPPVSAR